MSPSREVQAGRERLGAEGLRFGGFRVPLKGSIGVPSKGSIRVPLKGSIRGFRIWGFRVFE